MAHLLLTGPIGPLTLFEDLGAIVALEWGRGSDHGAAGPTALLQEARAQLNAYFDGRLRDFSLPLAPAGSHFQRTVWDEMLTIPYGRTRTYGALAAALESAPRAVGGACGRNPIPVIIPCHRVVARGGRLGGYSGHAGVETKRALLRIEGATFA